MKLELYSTEMWIATACAVAIFIITTIISSRYDKKYGSQARIEKAKKLGNIITAERDTLLRDYEETMKGTNKIYSAVYKYEFKGRKKRKYIHNTVGKPARTITIYYLGNNTNIEKPTLLDIIVRLIPFIATIVTFVEISNLLV